MKEMSILKELFLGNIHPGEHILPVNSKYQKTTEKILDEMAYWEKKLSREELNKLESLYALCSTASAMTEEQSFIYGFRLGALLMIEILYNK